MALAVLERTEPLVVVAAAAAVVTPTQTRAVAAAAAVVRVDARPCPAVVVARAVGLVSAYSQRPVR